MATASVNGLKIHYELAGSGEIPLVMVHGSWSSHASWGLVAPALSSSFRVLTYDRRGHSASERPAGQGSVHEDVADLAALIEDLNLAPAYIAGNSYGASVTLRLAATRPDLVRGLIAHEPPLFALLSDDPSFAPLLAESASRIAAVVETIRSGDHRTAAERFVETVALGSGSWSQLSPPLQATFVENAPTFLDEASDPEQLVIDPSSLAGFDKPVLLTLGDQSPPTFAPVVRELADVLPRAEVLTFPGAGHIPHNTHPDAYMEATTSFIRKNEE